MGNAARALMALLLFLDFPQTSPPAKSSNSSTVDSLYETEARAMEAYEKKDYAESVKLFDAAFSGGLNRPDDAYSAACSSSLVGAVDKALAYLERAARLGFRTPDQMQVDPDLSSIRFDPRFRLILQQVRQNEHTYLSGHGDPDRVAIVTDDIELFWRVYDRLQSSSNPEMLIENEYFHKGSSGLQDFIFARIHSAAALWKTMNQRSKYYAAIRPETLHIKDLAPRIRSSFKKMKELHADSTFPDVYFLIGRMNSGGTTGPSGLLIGADMFGKGLVFPADELDEWLRTAVDSVSNIPYTVAHELIHYQQKTEGKTLLAAAIQEGSADFIGELISGGALNKEVRAYGRQHEKELWIQFTKEMNGTDTSHWMYEGKVTNGRPADLGYFVGYRIAEAYYNQASDKKKAIAAILNEDADKLLNDSGYAGRFKNP
jgi:hypothetical protein